MSQALQARKDNDLQHGLASIKAGNLLAESACQATGGYREIWQRLRDEDENLRGSWDDHVERLEFYRTRMIAGEGIFVNSVANSGWPPDTFLSCGSPRL